ncbi:MAG: alpha/beta hydrolase family protein [Chloroflexota bacterium]|nr:alpha/beta hydrolase [Dehalococcoidia bacterium]MDW8254008.1 alpha/beta hydrolase family protein [Chloroflexota bacterium]
MSDRAFYAGAPPYQMYVTQRIPASPSRPVSVLFIHGAGHTGVCWEFLPDGSEGWRASFVQRGFPVYTVDLPGHGRSPLPPDFPTLGLGRAVAALAEVVQQAGPIILIGHSMGGHITDRVVASLSAEHRRNVRAVVLVAPVSPPDLASGGPVREETEPVRLEREMAFALFGKSERFPAAHFENYYRSLVPESPASYNEFQLARGVAPVGEGLYRDIPSLIVGGEQDFIPEASWQRRADYLGMELVMLGRDWGMPGHGHMVMLEEGADAIAARIIAWLEAKGVA